MGDRVIFNQKRVAPENRQSVSFKKRKILLLADNFHKVTVQLTNVNLLSYPPNFKARIRTHELLKDNEKSLFAILKKCMINKNKPYDSKCFFKENYNS
jgi:hypothetical protein